ncbi:MAG: WG repeat-containing protein [Crocinitomicaceae bacterium]|nr:WG repeat-containing protein [Crocinitomicaceae bacterium]
MKITKANILILFLLLVLSGNALAFGIQRGFEALEIYNYFKAKQIFERNLKRNTSAAAYGLSVIYFRQDNPFHDMEKAYHLSLKSIESYPNLRPRLARRLEEKFNVSLETLIAHRAQIAQYNYNLALQQKTISAMVEFKARHPWSIYKDSAENRQTELAYQRALSADNSAGYQLFLRHYGSSIFADEMQERLFQAQWNENIVFGSIESFDAFLENFPNHPYKKQAQDSIFYLATKGNTIHDFENFTKRYPSHPKISEAWLTLYQLSIANYTEENILSFRENYPDFPFPERIENDLLLLQQQLFPFQKDDYFGYMDAKGKVVIPPSYDYAGFFSNGLAAVMKDGKVGFINKSNEVIIPFQFDDAQDFEKGRSIVELDGALGVIDNTGHFILPPKFEDIGGYHQGITFTYQNGQYRYFDWEGNFLFNRTFDEAFSFSGGFAKVVLGDTIGFINNKGDFIFYMQEVQDVRIFKNDLFIVSFKDSMTLFNYSGERVLPFYVDRIGNIVENRAIIEKDDLYGYIDGSGNVVIPIQLRTFQNYFQFAQAKNGHFRFLRDGNFGLKDTLGKIVFTPIFQGIGNFNELTPVSKGRGWGYADAQTKLVIRYIYDYAYSFENGLAIVQRDQKMGVINLKGEELIPLSYDLIQVFDDNYFKVFRGQQFGIMDRTGELITDIIYNRFTPVSELWIQMVATDRLDYFNVTKGQLTTLLEEDE